MTCLLIHNNELTYRGDATNTQNVSLMLKAAGISSVVVVPKSERNHKKRISEIKENDVIVEEYATQRDLLSIRNTYGVTHSMFVHDGRYRNLWIPDTRLLVHAVFNNFEPYGDVYAYVSKWLYLEATRKKIGRTAREIEGLRSATDSPYSIDKKVKTTWVPHTVIPKVGDGESFRKRIGISQSSFLVGRIGGYTEFNDQEAKRAIVRLLEKIKGVEFIFINTRPFLIHPNVTYLGYISESEKWDFYDACNLLINGRLMGESFGFSIVEPLMVGKPIIAPSKSRNLKMDKHHVDILKPENLLYSSAEDFEFKVLKLMKKPIESTKMKKLVENFTEEKVRTRFIEEFLS